MTAKRYLIVPLAGAVLAAAGSGSSSSASISKTASGSHRTTKAASHARTRTRHHPSGSMPMHGSGTTAGTMLKMGMTAEHAEVTVGSSTHYGKLLYDKDHFVLYAFSADHRATSTCYGGCSSTHDGWPPLLTKGAPRVAGLKQSLVGTTKRRDGSLQVTYAGHPLYYWSGDTAHSILCQHVNLHGGSWYVVNADGKPNHAMGVGTMSMK
jgi:predicted lipoprotein with Yx(FWY)xxD motif